MPDVVVEVEEQITLAEGVVVVQHVQSRGDGKPFVPELPDPAPGPATYHGPPPAYPADRMPGFRGG